MKILYKIISCILLFQIKFLNAIFFEIFNQTKTYELYIESISNDQVIKEP
jgi:hypothetical protein